MSIDFCFQKQPQQPQQSNLSFQQQSAKMSHAQSTSNVSNIQQQNHHHRHFGLLNMEGSQSPSNLNHHHHPQPQQQQQQIESSSSPTSSINENFSRDSDTPPVIRWSRNFHNLIEDVDGVKLFSQYLDESNLLDMLNFWFACQGLKHQAGQQSTGTRDKIGRVVNAIFKKFIIKSNSIHLSDQMRQELIKQYTKSRQQPANDLLANPNIFDQAQQDIERLLSGAIYDNFLRSDHYMHYFSLVVYPNNNNNNDDNNRTNNDENCSQQAQQSSNSNKILLEPSATNTSRSNDEPQNESNDYHYNEGYSPKNYAEYLPTLNEELGEEEILEEDEEEEPEQEQQDESSTTLQQQQQLEQTFDSTAANASGQLMLDNSALEDSNENDHHQDQSHESPNDCCCSDEVPKNCSEEIIEKMSQISLQQQQQEHPQQRSLSRNTESINRSLTKSSSAQAKNQQQPNGYQHNQHSNPSSLPNIPSSHHQQPQQQLQSVYSPASSAILSSGTVAPPFCDLSSLSNSTIVKTASVPTKSQLLTNNNSKKSNNNYPTHNPRMFQSYLNSIKYENPPHPYHVMYNTVQPNSTRDSEIQSISSHSTGDSFSRISGNSRGDSDKFGKKGSGGGHSHSHQLRQHQQQLRTLNLNHSLLANSFGPGVGGFNQPRSQPRQSAIDPSTNIEAFAKDLIERLEKVRSNQEADSKLQNLLSSAYGRESPATGSMMNTSSLREAGVGQQSEISNKSTLTSSQNATNQPIVKSSLKEVLKKPVDFNFISENDQSILDKHCAQVFKTPNSGTPTGASVSATGVPLPVPGGGVVVPNSAYLLDSNHNNQSLRFYCSNDLVNNNNPNGHHNGPSQYLQYDSRSTQSTLPPPSPGYGPNSNSNFSFNQTPSGRASQQQQPNNSANLVIVTVKFHNDDCPYKLTMAGPNITLASFKMQIPPKRGHQRYYFKRKCTEMEMMESDFGNCQFIKEEITDENAILPQYDGKIFAMVEPKFANTYNNNNNHE